MPLHPNSAKGDYKDPVPECSSPTKQLFGEMSMEERFGDLSGAALMAKIFATYQALDTKFNVIVKRDDGET